MENRPLLEGPAPDPHGRKNSDNHLLARPQYIEVPSSAVVEEPGPGLLLEYFDIIRRHQGTLILIAFLGFLASILLTLPQTPIYQARASLEIQSINEDFLNMREMSPTANGGGSYPPQYDLQTQAKILQSESVLERVIAKLHLEEKLLQEKDRGRLSAWRNALGLPQWKSDSPREEVLRLVTKNLKVSTEASTRLVEILYDSKDPQLAADFLNSLTTEFIQQNLEARWKTSQQTGEWLTRQMEDVRIKLEKSEDELQSYAHSTGLLFTSEKVGTQLIEGNVAEDKLRQLQEINQPELLQPDGEGRRGNLKVAGQRRERALGQAGCPDCQAEDVFRHQERGREAVGPHLAGVLRLCFVVYVLIEVHTLVIAGKKVAQFMREREPLPRRNLRRAQDDQLRLVR